MNPTQVLIDLVSTPSVSGTERDAVNVFCAHAEELGFQVEIDDAGSGLAHRGEGPVHLMLLGHIDTVPGEIPVRVEDGILYGRGSVDAKGPLAAMLVAAAQVDLPAGCRVTVAAAVGEETAGSPGARSIAPRFNPSACIIGEPSGWDGVTLGYKGRLLVRAVAACATSHSAGEDPSACDTLLQWWSGVAALIEDLNADRRGVFNTLTVSTRSLRSNADGFRESATIDLGFRLPPWITPDALLTRLQAVTPRSITLDATGEEDAFATDRNDPVVRALGGAIRDAGALPKPKLKTGTADLNVAAPVWRCPIAAYGPGDSALDHTPDEHVSLSEWEASVGVLRSAIDSLASELLEHEPAAFRSD